jgi:NhaP-type Na+/H+ or K+/H+ antiporter
MGGFEEETLCERFENGTTFNCREAVVPFISLYFFFFGMTLALLTMWARERYARWLPFTLLIFVEGAVLGVVHAATHGGLGDVSKSIDVWVAIKPSLLLAVALPALIFSDAFRINVHEFLHGAFWPSLLLAGPGVGVSVGGVTLVAKGVVFPEWSWGACLLLGAALGATDPTSMVPLLAHSRTPPRLELLLASESHLGDLVGLIVFKIAIDLVSSEDGGHLLDTPGHVAAFLLNMLLTAPFVGMLFGFAGCWVIARNSSPTRVSDVMVQVATTVVVAYLSFLVAEHNLHANGAVATAVCAWVIAANAWPQFARRQTMENVWDAIQYFIQTAVYLLAGVLLGFTVFTASEALHGSDVLNAVLVWCAIMISRALAVVGSYPLLWRASRKRFTALEAIALIHGGIRGAVAITLGIVVLQAAEVSELAEPLRREFGEEYRLETQRFFVTVGLAVLLTLAFNYSTFPLLLSALKLRDASGTQRAVQDGLLRRLQGNAKESFEVLRASDETYRDVTFESVSDIVSTARPGHGRRGSAGSASHSRSASASQVRDGSLHPGTVQLTDCDPKMLQVVRTTFVGILRSEYWRQIEEGMLPRHSDAARALLHALDVAVDDAREGHPLDDWSLLRIERSLEGKSWAERALVWADRVLPDHVRIDDYLFFRVYHRRTERAVVIATSFLEAHQGAERKLAAFLGEGTEIDTPEEAYVIKESEELRRRAEALVLAATERGGPDVVLHVHRIKLANAVIASQARFLEELGEHGLADELFVDHEMEQVTADQERLLHVREEHFKNLAQGATRKRKEHKEQNPRDVEVGQQTSQRTLVPAVSVKNLGRDESGPLSKDEL